MAEILCPTCGKPNTDDHNFCDHCGAPLFSVDPLPPDSPSLRDDIFDNNDEITSSQSVEPLDESARLDSLLSPDEPLEEELLSPDPIDDSTRLDDLIPALDPVDGSPAEGKPQPDGEPDPASRLDDFFATDDPFTGPDEEKLPDPQTIGSFLDPSVRDELLGEESPAEKDGGEWEYLTETPSEDGGSEPTPAIEEPSDNLDFLSALSSDSVPESESPSQESAGEWDFLTEPSAEDEPVQKEEPTETRGSEWTFPY